MRQFRTPVHQTFQLRRLDPAHLLRSQMGCCTGNDPGGAPCTSKWYFPWNTTRKPNQRLCLLSRRRPCQDVAAQQDLGDEHVQNCINELTARDDHATIHQVGEAGGLQRLADESADIANQMQEVYEIVDADVENFVPS